MQSYFHFHFIANSLRIKLFSPSINMLVLNLCALSITSVLAISTRLSIVSSPESYFAAAQCTSPPCLAVSHY